MSKVSIGAKEFARLYSTSEIKIAKRIRQKNIKDKLSWEKRLILSKRIFSLICFDSSISWVKSKLKQNIKNWRMKIVLKFMVQSVHKLMKWYK